MRSQDCRLAAAIAVAAILVALPSVGSWAEIAGIPEVNETFVFPETLGGTIGTNGREILRGSPEEVYGGVASGLVRRFAEGPDGIWSEIGVIGPSDPVPGMRFGNHVVVEGSWAVIEAPDDPRTGRTSYVFEKTAGGAWIERAKLTLVARDISAKTGQTILGARRLVELVPEGWISEVPVYERVGATWQERQALASGEPGDHFGKAAALSDNVIVVTANGAELGGIESGAAYVYVKRDSGSWEFVQKLVGRPWGMDDPNFGYDVAVADDVIVVGAPCDWGFMDELPPVGACNGAAYIFRRMDDDHWIEEAKLVAPYDAPTPPVGAEFGDSVAYEGGLAYVCEAAGRPGEGGSCWAFLDQGAGTWEPIVRLIRSDPVDDTWGLSIDVEGGTILIAGGDRGPYVFVRDSLPLDLEVAIDIKPGNERNVINPRSKGRFWVAMLSDEGFDALQVDPQTVAFGSGAASPDRYKVKDPNRDRLPDLMLRFRTPEVGIQCGDTELELRGETYAGDSMIGTDAVKTVGCEKSKKGKKK